MANTKVADSGAARMTWLWMGVGVVTVGLFFWWISVSSEPSQVVAPQEDVAVAEGGAGAQVVQTVELAALTGAPAAYVAQEIHLASATITSVMGDNAFWIEGPSGPFLVVKAEEFTTSGGAAVASGRTVSITGRFWEQSPGTIQEWRETGFMTDGGHLAQAEFATHYIQAREIAPAEAGAADTTGQ